MKIIDVRQGTPEWETLRLGRPTASCFDQILTPAKLQPAKWDKYRNQLVAEWLLGYSEDEYQSVWMERGTALEPEARAHYEVLYDVEVVPVGFMLRDDEKVGASPDGLIGTDGGLELKCPAAKNHVGFMLDPEGFAKSHRGQLQGNLYIAEREWWDLYSYYPGLPAVVKRIYRDEKWMKAFGPALTDFLADLDACKAKLREHRTAPETEELEVAA